MEIQFHAKKSHKIKEGQNHKIYELQRKLDGTDPNNFEIIEKYENMMKRNSLKIPNPPGVEKIKL